LVEKTFSSATFAPFFLFKSKNPVIAGKMADYQLKKGSKWQVLALRHAEGWG